MQVEWIGFVLTLNNEYFGANFISFRKMFLQAVCKWYAISKRIFVTIWLVMRQQTLKAEPSLDRGKVKRSPCLFVSDCQKCFLSPFSLSLSLLPQCRIINTLPFKKSHFLSSHFIIEPLKNHKLYMKGFFTKYNYHPCPHFICVLRDRGERNIVK